MDWANVTPGELMDALREVRVSCVDSRVATPRDGPDHATWMQRRIQPKAPKLNDSSPPLRLPRRWTGTCVPAP